MARLAVLILGAVSLSLAAHAQEISNPALEALNARIEAAPNDPALLVERGRLRFFLQDYSGASADLWNATVADPSLRRDTALQIMRGRAVMEAGRPADAARVFETVSGTRIGRSRAMGWKAEALDRAGDREAALAALEAALALDPGNLLALAKQDELRTSGEAAEDVETDEANPAITGDEASLAPVVTPDDADLPRETIAEQADIIPDDELEPEAPPVRTGPVMLRGDRSAIPGVEPTDAANDAEPEQAEDAMPLIENDEVISAGATEMTESESGTETEPEADDPRGPTIVLIDDEDTAEERESPEAPDGNSFADDPDGTAPDEGVEDESAESAVRDIDPEPIIEDEDGETLLIESVDRVAAEAKSENVSPDSEGENTSDAVIEDAVAIEASPAEAEADANSEPAPVEDIESQNAAVLSALSGLGNLDVIRRLADEARTNGDAAAELGYRRVIYLRQAASPEEIDRYAAVVDLTDSDDPQRDFQIARLGERAQHTALSAALYRSVERSGSLEGRNLAIVRGNLASQLLIGGDQAAALAAADRAIDADPDYANAIAVKAIILDEMGDDEALGVMRAAYAKGARAPELLRRMVDKGLLEASAIPVQGAPQSEQ